MPRIDKVKKTKKTSLSKKHLPVTVKVTKLKTKKVKQSPVDYYNCLLTKAQAEWYDPTTGKKKKITACCKDFKLNAPKLQEKRTQEVKKLITSYQQVGESLKRLLKPIK